MLKNLTWIVFLLITPAWASAQQSRPLSAPDRPPVPLSDADQERARADEAAKQKDKARSPEASVVKIDEDLPLNRACLVGCVVTTGWGSAVNRLFRF